MNHTFKSHSKHYSSHLEYSTMDSRSEEQFLDLRHGWCSQGHTYQVLGKYPKRDAAATRGTARRSFVTQVDSRVADKLWHHVARSRSLCQQRMQLPWLLCCVIFQYWAFGHLGSMGLWTEQQAMWISKAQSQNPVEPAVCWPQPAKAKMPISENFPWEDCHCQYMSATFTWGHPTICPSGGMQHKHRHDDSGKGCERWQCNVTSWVFSLTILHIPRTRTCWLLMVSSESGLGCWRRVSWWWRPGISYPRDLRGSIMLNLHEYHEISWNIMLTWIWQRILQHAAACCSMPQQLHLLPGRGDLKAELLAELSQKMASTNPSVPAEPTDAWALAMTRCCKKRDTGHITEHTTGHITTWRCFAWGVVPEFMSDK